MDRTLTAHSPPVAGLNGADPALRTGPAPARRERAVRFETPFALGASLALVWVAQFHHFAEFGLYEDDYWFISQAMGKDLSYLLARLQSASHMPQGRPLGFFLPDLFSFVGDKLGGLPAIYVLGYLVVVLNTFLCYRLLRVRVPMAPAAVGAAVFCLFPVDTTRIFLTHDFQLQPSLTFALLSGLLYASGRLPAAYAVGACSLLAYENGFLPLFGLPLVLRPWSRFTLREMARHVLVLLGILALAVIARVLVGEPRASESVGGVVSLLPRIVGSLILGPSRAVLGSLAMPPRSLRTWSIEAILLAALATLIAAAALPRLRAAASRRSDVIQVAAAGAVMLVAAYALAFTHYPPVALVGRGTSVHLGATLGAAALASAAAWYLLGLRGVLGRLTPALLAAYLGLAVGYQVVIERDFARSWQIQRSFWQDVAACCSDLEDGTVLIYELPPSDESTTFIFTNSWGDALVLAQLFRFPTDWADPPRLFSLVTWHERVHDDGHGLQWWVPSASWDEHWEVLPQSNVILLRRAADGRLERVTGEVALPEGTLHLKDPAPPVAWPAAQLYPLLLR